MAEIEEHKYEETTHTDDSNSGNPPKPGEKPASKETESSDLDERIAKAVAKALKDLGTGDKPAGSTRRADLEAQAERMVREASERLKLEEEHNKEHETLKQKAEQIVERAPKKLRRSTKLMWGSDE